MVPFRKKERQQIAAVVASKGFVPFGNHDGPTLFFRSQRAWLRIEWDRGYVHATLAARFPEGREYDDDLLRQTLCGEAGHPDGVRREWTDLGAFLEFLQSRLDDFVEAVASAKAEFLSRIVEVDGVRRERIHRWSERSKLPLSRRRIIAPD